MIMTTITFLFLGYDLKSKRVVMNTRNDILLCPIFDVSELGRSSRKAVGTKGFIAVSTIIHPFYGVG